MLHKCVSPACQALYSYVVTSSELATRAGGRLSGFRAASAGWLVVPRSNRGLDLLAHHESCGSSSRQRNRYISDLSCLSASHVCVHWNPAQYPDRRFSFQKISSYCCFSAGWLALAREWEAAISILVERRAEQWLSKDEADFCRYDDVLRFRIRIRGGGLLPGRPHCLLLLLHPSPSALASDGFPPRLDRLQYLTILLQPHQLLRSYYA